MRKRMLAGAVLMGAMSLVISGCSGSTRRRGRYGVLGWCAVRARSRSGSPRPARRAAGVSANTESMKAAFSKENGFDLIFNAADNDPAAQIAAVRSFINQGVDAIVIAPIVEDGWDDVLQGGQGRQDPGGPRGPHRVGPRQTCSPAGSVSTSRRRA